MRKLAMLAAACAVVLSAPSTLDGSEPLTLQVSPAMAPAPAFVSVRAHIESNDDNRMLEIVAKSDDFYRSSVMELDGDRAPRTTVFEFRSVPVGTYHVRAELVGSDGQEIAYAQSQVNVVGGNGY